MTIAEAVRAHLLTLSPVTALVNSRIWTLRMPQNATMPAVLVQQVSEVQSPHLRGTDSLKWARVQVDCVAATIAAARALDQAILGDYTGGVPTGLRGAVANVGSPTLVFRSVESIAYREYYEGDELKQSRVTRDYRIWVEDV